MRKFGLMLAVAALAFGMSGYATFHDHVHTYGIVGQNYWLDASARPHETAIDDAIAAWNATPTPFAYSQTSTRSNAELEFWKVDGTYDWWAATVWYKSGGFTRVDPDTANWQWEKVKMAGDFEEAPSRKAICVHEIGHSIGLAHVFSGTAIMRYDVAWAVSYKNPQTDDINGVNHLY